jgi:hypothetical protein
VLLTPNERRVAEDRRDCYWLYIVTNCNTNPALQEPIKDPAQLEWHEVKKVAHYWLEVNALKDPMTIKEDASPYGASTDNDTKL